MKKFEPIAIIGQGCVLPGCSSPEDVWKMVLDNRVNLKAAEEEDWRVNTKELLVAPGETTTKDKVWNTIGGYIKDFDNYFDAGLFQLESDFINKLDPVFKWSMYAAHSALKDAGYTNKPAPERTGLIMGNLGYPTRSFSNYFEEFHLHRMFPEWKNQSTPIDPINRFGNGMPAVITAKALGLKGDSFAIDAACASSLYALHLACNKLNDGYEDMMLVGGVCASDQLFLHLGFTALNALSPTGQSRPFNKDADGLIPSEGAGFIVVKRLKDAVKSKDNILGVIRGIGLSNDGKQGGFLSPAKSGQIKSMQKALLSSGVEVNEVSYIECHATGTGTGDSIEIESMQEVYGKDSKIHLSSLKGNIGHAITASGIAGIIKVLGAFKNNMLPPVPNAFPLNPALSSTNFSVSDQALEWKNEKGKIAAISNFGFGGNNAHLILQEWNPKLNYPSSNNKVKKSKVAIIGLEIGSSKFKNTKEYLEQLLGNENKAETNDSISFNIRKLSSPPNDLKSTLSQQLLLLQTAQQLIDNGIKLDKEQTGVFIGFGTDAEVNRYGLRVRIKDLLEKGGITISEDEIEKLKSEIIPALNSAGVLGTMPNIPANRINYHFDYSGMGYTFAAEELSGAKALSAAINSIQNRELISALVGAVDISDEPLNKDALQKVFGKATELSDTAIVLVLKDYESALKDGDGILASIDPEEKRETQYSTNNNFILSKAGYSHACSALTEIATAILLTRHRLQMNEQGNGLKPIIENQSGFSYRVNCKSQFGGSDSFEIHSEPIADPKLRTSGKLLIHCYAAKSKEELIHALQKNEYSSNGKHRLGIKAAKEDLPELLAQAIILLEKDNKTSGWLNPNILYRTEKTSGDLAFVFTGAASAYPQMGKNLLEEFPGIVGSLHSYWQNPSIANSWIYEDESEKADLPFYQLAGSSFLCQIHAAFTKNILGIKPQAVIGLSSGETNSMFATGTWGNMDELLTEIDASGLYTKALGVEFESIKKFWNIPAEQKTEWENWRVLAPVEKVKELLKKEERVYLCIINTNNDCVIGGDKTATRRILDEIGYNKAIPLKHDIAIHCAPVEPFEKPWRKLHTREVIQQEGIHFYSNFLDGKYIPTKSSVADALTGQAWHTIDFPKIVEKAWQDGVRIFVEHGPRNSLSVAIKEILKGRDFLCVSLDRAGQSGLTEALKAACELWCAGVDINMEALQSIPETVENKGDISFPMHLPQIPQKLNLEKEIMQKSISDKQETSMAAAPNFAIPKRRKSGIVIPEKREIQSENKSNSPIQLNDIPHQHIPLTELRVPSTELKVNDQQIHLIKNQHIVLTEAHQSYIQSQLAGQQRYAGFMQQMLNGLIENLIDNNSTDEDIQIQTLSENTKAEFGNGKLNIPVVDIESKIEVNKTSAKSNALNTFGKPGLQLKRAQLEQLSSGKVSDIFGSDFHFTDDYPLQVRLPQAPYLFCDRVSGIQGEQGSYGPGIIWTETDIKVDSWYLLNGRMPAGILSEASQGFILLCSWLGLDKIAKGKKVLRLLGCEASLLGPLPKPGDILKFEVRVGKFNQLGDTTLVLFEYECYSNGKLLVSAKNGSAGLFTPEELNSSPGINWDAGRVSYSGSSNPEFSNATSKNKFSREEIEAYCEGDLASCFGANFNKILDQNSKTNYINYLHPVSVFELKGGPAKKGYIQSIIKIDPEAWYFEAHFKNDPCMPATIIADTLVQMMGFFLIGSGITIPNGAWRFEPVQDIKNKIGCGGQVTPESKTLVYEVFIDRIIEGENPEVYAHILASVDGVKAFLCENLGVKLIVDAKIEEVFPTPVSIKSEAAVIHPSPKFSRAQLEVLASGKISDIFGPLFQQQDQYHVQVRMPEPPLLLCDRVTGIKGEPGTLGKGIIWTETDVTSESWYLHNNRMPPGLFIEAGQADLLLISYLGIDFQNKGEKAYRLLGCELVFYGELPAPGDTLKYEIHVDGYATTGETTLFFFHYDCHINGKLRISVRHGQAGFFSVKELEESKGVIWSPETAEYSEYNGFIPECATSKRTFSAKEVEAYTLGDMVTCFGKELEWTQTHTRSPRSQKGDHNLIQRVTEFDLKGGPAKRGYLRSEFDVNPDNWFFKGHFKNDPCMPGTLMADACMQMMAFYMVGSGLTIKKDGWRFEPVQNEKYKFVCRGQVLPESKKITYEIFVDEIIAGDYPTLYAHVLTTVDGNKAFLCERLGLRLVPDWPLSTMQHLIVPDIAGKKIAQYKGFKFGYESLISCAWGKPSNAFGPEFNNYDGHLRSPRLPGPPYHFITRISEFTVVPGEYKNEPYVVADYDIPSDAWYFNGQGKACMPYSVLMEVALQPCGWLSTFICQNDIKGKDLLFRNLDGKGVQHREITPNDKTIVTKTTLKGASFFGEIVIVNFDVVLTIEDEIVYSITTVFGFFDTASMVNQKGLTITPIEGNNLNLESNAAIDLISYPSKYFAAGACLPSSKLLMIDRVVANYPEGGKYGKGYMRSEKDVEKNEWFFKAHFFQDPVQPGSLGVEAIIQLMKFYMLESGYQNKFSNPVFEPIAISNEIEWHYRGQVTPDKKLICIDFDQKEIVEETDSITICGEARLWVDGLKIYHLPAVSLRIKENASNDAKKSQTIFMPDLAIRVQLEKTGAGFRSNNLPYNEIIFSKDTESFSIGSLNKSLLQNVHAKEEKTDLLEDLKIGLLNQFVRAIVFEDYPAMKACEGKPVLYVANHQTGIESILFVSLANIFNRIDVKAIAKMEHKDSWIGEILSISNLKSKNKSALSFLPYDRDKPEELIKLLGDIQKGDQTNPFSLLVHVEGTRDMHLGIEVKKISALLLDHAIACGMPIVPVRFTSGLPLKGKERLDFPYLLGKQDYYIGKPIDPITLSKLPLKERKHFVLDAINQLVPKDFVQPYFTDDAFEKIVNENMHEHQVGLHKGVFLSILKNLREPSEETIRILQNKNEEERPNSELELKLVKMLFGKKTKG